MHGRILAHPGLVGECFGAGSVLYPAEVGSPGDYQRAQHSREQQREGVGSRSYLLAER